MVSDTRYLSPRHLLFCSTVRGQHPSGYLVARDGRSSSRDHACFLPSRQDKMKGEGHTLSFQGHFTGVMHTTSAYIPLART